MTKKKNTPNVIAEMGKRFDLTEAEKKSDTYYFINGWRIKFNTRGVYLNTRDLPELLLSFDTVKQHIKKIGGRPFIYRSDLSDAVMDNIVKAASVYKTNSVKKRERLERKRLERTENRRLEKRTWCNGCELSPQGINSKKCDNMIYEEEIGHYYCKDTNFYSWYYCKNLVHSYVDKSKKWTRKFTCGITSKSCPYQEKAIAKDHVHIGRNIDGEHYTTCELYEGSKVEPEWQANSKTKQIAKGRKKTHE